MKRFPEILTLFRANRVNLTTVGHVAAILDEDNKREILEKIADNTEEAARRLVAEHRPQMVLRDRVRPVAVRVPKPESRSETESGESRSGTRATSANQESHSGTRARPEKAFEVVTRLELRFAVSPEVMNKLEEARALLSQGSRPTLEAVLDASLDAFLEKRCPRRREERRKLRASKRQPADSRPKRAAAAKRTIPKKIRDQVWTRDQGRCRYVGPTGKRCRATSSLQVDHVVPRARGGPNVASNLRLLCERHNKLAAENAYGKDFMERFYKRE